MWCARDASEYEIRLDTHSAGMLVFAPSLVVQRMRVNQRPESAVDTREICQACPALLKIIMLIIA